MTKLETILFPVVFFDGEREMNIGNVAVYPSLDYKTLQLLLSRKIGISPNQFSVYLAESKTARRSPITGKSNFSAIYREKDCCFLVVLRRSRDSLARRQRRRAEHQHKQQQPAPAANVMLLKRDNNTNYYKMNGEANGGVLVCEECARAKELGREIGFHWCVYDAVTFGFRSPAGPIARPVK